MKHRVVSAHLCALRIMKFNCILIAIVIATDLDFLKYFVLYYVVNKELFMHSKLIYYLTSVRQQTGSIVAMLHVRLIFAILSAFGPQLSLRPRSRPAVHHVTSEFCILDGCDMDHSANLIVSDPTAWNSLLTSVCDLLATSCFCRQLKTELFC